MRRGGEPREGSRVPSSFASWWGWTGAVAGGVLAAHAVAHGLFGGACHIAWVAAAALLLGGVAASVLLSRLTPLRRWMTRGLPVPPSPAALRDLGGALDMVAFAGAFGPLWLGGIEWGVGGWEASLPRWGGGALAVTLGAAGLSRLLAVPVLHPWFRAMAGAVEGRDAASSGAAFRWALGFTPMAVVGGTMGSAWGEPAAKGAAAAVALLLAAALGWLGTIRCRVPREGDAGEPDPGPAPGHGPRSEVSRDARPERWRRARLQAVAFLAHDLRAPLNALIGFSEMLRRGEGGAELSDAQREDVQLVERAARSMLGRVDVVLACARLEMGGVGRACWVPAVELLGDALHRAHRLWEGAVPIRVDVEMGAGLAPVWIEKEAAERTLALLLGMLAEHFVVHAQQGSSAAPRLVRLHGGRHEAGLCVEVVLEPPCCPDALEGVLASRLLETACGLLGATLSRAHGASLRIAPLGSSVVRGSESP